MRIGRVHVQRTLGALWLIDGVLQLQPFMFTRDFAHQILLPAADGQPDWVAAPLRLAAKLTAEQPVLSNLGFALIQLALGAGLLLPRTVRPALAASVVWSLGVWWLGEGLGGLASGHASLLTGAPGAVLLYAILAIASWPAHDPHPHRRRGQRPVSDWFPYAWATLWIGGALLLALPGQRGAAGLADDIRGSADDAPAWLASVDHAAARGITYLGVWGVVGLAIVLTAIGLAGLRPGRMRTVAAGAGVVVAAAFWLVGQSMGAVFTGQSTDPNTGPLLVLSALALSGIGQQRRPAKLASFAQQRPLEGSSRLHGLVPTRPVS